jgi:hypothetical protein
MFGYLVFEIGKGGLGMFGLVLESFYIEYVCYAHHRSDGLSDVQTSE